MTDRTVLDEIAGERRLALAAETWGAHPMDWPSPPAIEDIRTLLSPAPAEPSAPVAPEGAISLAERLAANKATESSVERIRTLEAENAALLGKLERCASVAEGASASFDFQSALAECRDHDAGYHSGRVAAAKDVRALLQGGADV